MFHTPPINNLAFDSKQSILESYKPSDNHKTAESSSSSKISVKEVEQQREPNKEGYESEKQTCEITSVTSIPEDLMKLIDIFIDDLKQPKYSKPLSILQLSHIFQQFYERFDRSCQQHFNNVNSSVNSNVLLHAQESKNSGLSSIFNRSRSGSFRNGLGGASRSRTRTNSQHSYQQLLTPEEINQQIKVQEQKNHKVDQILDLCESEVFRKIVQVGTHVPSSDKTTTSASNVWRMTSLFRNSPEFIEFDRKLDEKLCVLQDLSNSDTINLSEFLNVNVKDRNSFKDLETIVENMLEVMISPAEKISSLLMLHDEMIKLEHNNTDDILPTLIFLLINQPRKELFLNLHFIKLFRFHQRLKERELYVTTNFEAAISFVDSLSSEDLLAYCNQKEVKDFPKLISISNEIKLPLQPDTQQRASDFKRSNSLSDLLTVSSAIDSGLRNLMGRIRTYTPPPAPPQITPVPFQSDSIDKVPPEWKKYQDLKFEDLKISEMQDVFQIYKALVSKGRY